MYRSLTFVVTILTVLAIGEAARVGRADAKEKAAPPAAAKEADSKQDADKAPKEKKAKKEKAAKKPAGQLPPYYSSVINDDQRDKVVSTYSKFNTKIGKLKDEIKSVTADRDKALEDLLTDEQKTKLAQLKTEAKAKRAKTDK